MIKRAIAVTAGLCMIYGSALLPQAHDGEPVKTKVATDLQQTCNSKTEAKNLKTKIRAKEDYGKVTVGETQDQPVKEGIDGVSVEAEPDETGNGGVAGQSGGVEQLNGEDQARPDGAGVGGNVEGLGQPECADTGSDNGSGAEEPDEGDGLEGVEPYQEPTVQEEVTADYLGTWTITAYCGCSQCCGEWDMETASGAYPISGHTVACNILPFGTNLLIDGIVYTVEDTGYTEYGDYWIDIYFSTHQEALNYGVQEHEVYLVY